MPLSDREQQLLEQMERALIEEDPRFATSMRGGPRQARNRRRLAIGVGGVLVGLAVILLGVTTKLVVVGALGFALMVGAVIYAMTDKKTPLRAVPTQGAAPRPAKSRKKTSSSFMDKMEKRWEQRRDEGRF
jgi:membrane-associated phospholipid phosphatase